MGSWLPDWMGCQWYAHATANVAARRCIQCESCRAFVARKPFRRLVTYHGKRPYHAVQDRSIFSGVFLIRRLSRRISSDSFVYSPKIAKSKCNRSLTQSSSLFLLFGAIWVSIDFTLYITFPSNIAIIQREEEQMQKMTNLFTKQLKSFCRYNKQLIWSKRCFVGTISISLSLRHSLLTYFLSYHVIFSKLTNYLFMHISFALGTGSTFEEDMCHGIRQYSQSVHHTSCMHYQCGK